MDFVLSDPQTGVVLLVRGAGKSATGMLSIKYVLMTSVHWRPVPARPEGQFGTGVMAGIDQKRHCEGSGCLYP